MDEGDAPVAVFKKRTNNKSNLRKRAATPPPASSSSDSDSDGYSSTGEDGPKTKRPRKTGPGVLTSSTTDGSKNESKSDIIDVLGITKYSGDRSSYIAPSDDATKQSNWYEEKDLLGTTRAINKTQASGPSLGGTTKKPPGTMGPVKAPTNVRMVTITDYAPDICKDYRQTGFCGFGDSCKFSHVREAYSQGWALDKEWEISTKGTKNLKGTVIASAKNRNGSSKETAEDEAEIKELEKIPFKCIICKDDYKDPVVTRCGHYYCEKCALDRYKKNPSCLACGQGTNGVFNVARNLKKLLEKKKAREERLRKEQEEAEAEADE